MKLPLTVQQIYGIRVRLDFQQKWRDLALFNLGIDSKLRGIDLVQLKVKDIANGNLIQSRAMVIQQKTDRPVQFEITKATREALSNHIKRICLRATDYLFQSHKDRANHLSTRQYHRIVKCVVDIAQRKTPCHAVVVTQHNATFATEHDG